MKKIKLISFIMILSSYYSNAYAEFSLFEEDGLTLKGHVDASAAYFQTGNTNFGAGRFDFFTGENTGDAYSFEAVLEAGIKADYDLKNWGGFYGGISALAVATEGDGDAGGVTTDKSDLDLENLYIGWRSGEMFADSLGQDALKVSYGRQELQIGSGLLIYDGNYDMHDKGAYWLAPRSAFKRAGLVQLDTENYHGDLFYLKSDYTQEHTELVGINFERKNVLTGSVGASYMHILDSQQGLFGLVRDEMDIYTARFSEISASLIPELDFWGQYTYQGGQGKQGKIEAEGWFLEAKYSFSELPWTPSISYRYSSFSGDNDSTDNTSNNFDPLFYGFSRGWGTWYQGEIVGSYLLFNSNQRTQMLHLNASPTENLNIGAMYFNFKLDERNFYGAPVSNRNFANEINLYADLTLSDNVSISALYGVALPEEGAKDAFGDNKAYQLFEMMLYVYF